MCNQHMNAKLHKLGSQKKSLRDYWDMTVMAQPCMYNLWGTTDQQNEEAIALSGARSTHHSNNHIRTQLMNRAEGG